MHNERQAGAASKAGLHARRSSYAVLVVTLSSVVALPRASPDLRPIASRRLHPTLRPAPLGFRPVLAVGFRETMSWAGRRHATQGHDLMRGHGFGGHARPQPRGAGDAGADRAVGHRRRQGGRGHRSHPRARSEDHAAEHGRLPSTREVVERIRGSGSDVAHQPDHRAGRALRAGRRGPAKPGPGTTIEAPAERVRHVVELKPDICSLDMGSMNMGPHVFVNTPPHLEAMALAIRDAGVLPELEVFETGHLLLAKRMIETGHIKRARHVPDLPRHRLGPAGDPGGHELYAQPAAARARPGSPSASRCYQFPDGGTGGAARRASAGRTGRQHLSGKGKLAPSNAALVEKAGKIIEILGDIVATPADARAMLGLQAASRSRNRDECSQRVIRPIGIVPRGRRPAISIETRYPNLVSSHHHRSYA